MLYVPPLQTGLMIKRYKRFLVDLDVNNCILTVHCANTGRMTGCAEPNTLAYYTTSNNAKRKYPHSLELTTSLDGHLICVNTARANNVAIEALQSGKIAPLAHYDKVQAEVPYGSEKSRIDALLSQSINPEAHCYVEVKSVTLLENGKGYFPDAPSVRGQKHLRELMEMKAQGHRAVLLFIVMHNGIQNVHPAAHIDPHYASLCIDAQKAGVEFLAYRAQVSKEELIITDPLPIIIKG
ncbi:DNA/RNA nuclease SfsA [Pseudoalteromonas xiamenensis]|uniref:Sugar fermentation stimulation protein homolog n=1 Tax=Pseudoalteromonas xiamenensis TaxID=882626 RepID=A0A975DJ41_9GAMM|nr:DNA/RNA nuclease SfsA [Pseudoalteromonas xiamenensis]QTH72484.1 DNA/RNA nuclease SfsA [Pseudoalteromonas xiamenensis]